MGKKNKTDRQYIEEKPCFNDLAELRDMLQSALTMVSSLADEGDTPQRATDLMIQISEIKSRAKSVLYKEE